MTYIQRKCPKHGCDLAYWPTREDYWSTGNPKYRWQCPACIGEEMARKQVEKSKKPKIL